MNPWRRVVLPVLAGLFWLGAGGCRPAAPTRMHTREFPGMGTTGSVVSPDAEQAGRHAALCADVTRAWERRLSVFLPDSDVARLNAAAGGDPIEISADTLRVLEEACRIGRDSGGAFDPTVGPMMEAWGFRGGQSPERPSEAALSEARARIGLENIEQSGRYVRLVRAGMRLDLGGIGKGYAVDRCWDALQVIPDHGPFLVNLGGNMRASGRPHPGRPWTAGVQDPFQRGGLLGVIRLDEGQAVATSGHYERFVVIEGERVAHIMDPRTGQPVRGMAGVTVVADTASEADGLSTALFVLGMEAGEAMLARTGRRTAVLYVPDRQPAEVWVNADMSGLFEPRPGLTVRPLF